MFCICTDFKLLFKISQFLFDFIFIFLTVFSFFETVCKLALSCFKASYDLHSTMVWGMCYDNSEVLSFKFAWETYVSHKV